VGGGGMSFRLIPFLLLSEGGLVKTVRFRRPRYVGDPINAVRIFNDKEVDEFIVTDMGAARRRAAIPTDVLADIAGEAFMPMCYGGGVRTLDDVARLVAIGIEKVAINTAALEDGDLVRRAAEQYGSQSIAISIDVRRSRRGATVWGCGGTVDTGVDPVSHAERVAAVGAGEIVLGSIDRDGTRSGYDLDVLRRVVAAVDIPVVIVGGAGSLEHFRAAFETGAAGAAAGSMFVFHGRRDAVLISYPSPDTRAALERPR
jgi:cyclase